MDRKWLIAVNEKAVLLCVEISIIKKAHEKLERAHCLLLGTGNSRTEY